MQFDFQAVIATDGKLSFVIFYYGNQVELTTANFPLEVGFDAGNQFLYGTVQPTPSCPHNCTGQLFETDRSFENGLIFRVDGMYFDDFTP